MDPNTHISKWELFLRQFAELTAEDFDLVSPHLTLTHFKKKELIAAAGKHCKTMYFLSEGIAMCSNYDETGRLSVKDFFSENQFFTDLQSILTGETMECDFVAVSDCTLISLPYSALQEAYSRSHAVERIGRLMVERAFVSSIITRKPAVEFSPELRYEGLEQSRPDLIERVPLKYLASFLHMSPETLSRIRSKRVAG